MAKTLSNTALKTINRIGDIICPKNGEFPSYSETGCVEHVNSMIIYAPDADIGDLNMLLSILSVMPSSVLRWLVNTMTASHQKEGGFATLMRQLDFGLKGIILGTYYSGKVGSNYSGKKPTEVIEFDINRMEK